MACDKVIIDVIELDESNDIYPCKNSKCCKFHKSIDKYEALENAIYYLKPQRVKKLLENSFSKKELSNPKCKFNKYWTNLLHSTISNICSTSSAVGVGIPSIDKIGVYAFGNSRYGLFPNQKIGSE